MVDEYGEVGHKDGMTTTCWDNDILTISIRIMILYSIIYILNEYWDNMMNMG